MFVYLNLHIEFPMLRYLIKIHVIPLQPRLSKTASPCKVFFHWTPELLGLGRQIGQTNSGAFGVFSAKLFSNHFGTVHGFHYSTIISTKPKPLNPFGFGI